MDAHPVTRREAIGRAAIAGLMLPFLGSARALGQVTATEPRPLGPLKPGLASYSFRKLPTDAAIAAMGVLGITSVSPFKVHVPILVGTPDDCRAAAAKFRDAGIAFAGTGVVGLSGSETLMRRAFECGKAAGMTLMTASYTEVPDKATLQLTERFVREYDIRLAFHNHGPEDKVFPSPFDVWEAVKPYDVRMGLCIDVGHTARAGVDPVEAIRRCADRLYDVHMKDTKAGPGVKKDIPVGLGLGRLDIRAIIGELQNVSFMGQVGLEYEVEADNPVPGVAQSYGYLRGVMDALSPHPQS